MAKVTGPNNFHWPWATGPLLKSMTDGIIRVVACLRGTNWLYFIISTHLKSGLMREVIFSGSGLIRGGYCKSTLCSRVRKLLSHWREQVTIYDDDDDCFTLDQHEDFDFYIMLVYLSNCQKVDKWHHTEGRQVVSLKVDK